MPRFVFFEEANRESAVVYKTTVYMKLELVEVWKDWAKVKFSADDQIKEGWLMRTDQCAYPWTNCTNAGGSCDD